MFRIIVLASGNGSNLQAIINNFAIPTSPYAGNVEIVGVISDDPNAYALRRANYYNIPIIPVPKILSTNTEIYGEHLKNAVSYFKPDLIVLAGFMRILSPNFIQAFSNKIINIHPSLLPKFKGLNTYHRVLEAGEKEHGMTIHWVTEELDAGPIIFQAKFEIQEDDTETTLKSRTQNLEHKWYPEIINDIALRKIIHPNKRTSK